MRRLDMSPQRRPRGNVEGERTPSIMLRRSAAVAIIVQDARLGAGLALRSESLPRLVGFRTHGASVKAWKPAAPGPPRRRSRGPRGTGCRGREFGAGANEPAGLADIRCQRPPALALELLQICRAERGHETLGVRPPAQRTAGWSCRPLPTGRSARAGICSIARSAAGPIPTASGFAASCRRRRRGSLPSPRGSPRPPVGARSRPPQREPRRTGFWSPARPGSP